MKIKLHLPEFMKSIRFRLAAWYLITTALLLGIFIIGINTAMYHSQPETPPPLFPGDSHTWQQTVKEQQEQYRQNLKMYSIIGAVIILVMVAGGGYILARAMLKPVDRVSTLASHISHTNLKERINHHGPDDEVKRLSDTFDGMLQRLETAFESQKQFIQDASHELRTPIAIAQTNIEVLEMQPNPGIEDYRHLIDVIKLSMERMVGVSNNLLLLSEGTPSKTKWVEIDPGTMLSEIQAETEMEAAAGGITMEVNLPAELPAIKGDPLSLKQAVVNLVNNAIKYNRPGGKVTISAGAENSGIAITVTDTGIGISPQDMEHIFDRFYRVEKSRSREKGGSGLGLAIVKKTVEDHGGQITATSQINLGSSFKITLPRS
jgi:signal transduction histidine kinase